jgi:arginyl-tRNA synthetase
MTPFESLQRSVRASAEAVAGSPVEQIRVERPPRPELGDFSTNAPLLLAPRLGVSPHDVAERVAEELTARLGERLERTDVAGPGFLNLYLRDSWFADALAHVVEAGERYGAREGVGGPRVNVEFVSANPTGPLHIGHARQAAYGDAVARLLEFCGADVTREYYINDYGSQMIRLAESVRALALGEPVPEDGYRGDYVAELVAAERARELDIQELAREAGDACLARIAESLERFRVHFDVWSSERALHERRAVERSLALLAERGETFTEEGALWLRTSRFGDDKDRVLVRSSGEHTYFASDIAYLEDKRERGFGRLIFVWGADHHGYVGRLVAASEALGGDRDSIEIVIQQFVHLVSASGRSAMSKREGEFVTLDELAGEIGVDAARFFLLARSHDTTVDLDLDLAVRQSSDNPVYYVQYAHARIASILARAGEGRVAEATAGIAPVEPLHPSERMLIHRLVAFPADVLDAAERRAPHRITACVLDLAQQFTAFYRDCRVLGAEPAATESFRLALALAAQRTIATALGLIGVNSPDRM